MKLVSDKTILYSTRRKHLPAFGGGIYYIYAWSKLIYIGRTWRFSQRLYKHSHELHFKEYGVTHIRLLQYEYENDLDFYKEERRQIALHEPVINMKPRRSFATAELRQTHRAALQHLREKFG